MDTFVSIIRLILALIFLYLVVKAMFDSKFRNSDFYKTSSLVVSAVLVIITGAYYFTPEGTNPAYAWSFYIWLLNFGLRFLDFLF